MQKHKIIIQGLLIHAHHGVLEQERVVGADFSLDLEVNIDFKKAVETDNLTDTINYADIYEIVKGEMAVPSQLLEHAGGRIVKTLRQTFPDIKSIKLRLMKVNPPLGADCKGKPELHRLRHYRGGTPLAARR